MEQSDYLKRQIDQLGLVLAKLLASILGLPQKEIPANTLAEIDRVLQNELSLNTKTIAASPKSGFAEMLKTDKGASDESISLLADLIMMVADNMPDDAADKKLLYEQSLAMYEFLRKNETTFSFGNWLSVDFLKEKLKKYNA